MRGAELLVTIFKRRSTIFEHKPKATKTHLKKVQELKELLQAQLDAGTTPRFRSVDQPLGAGEVRNHATNRLLKIVN